MKIVIKKRAQNTLDKVADWIEENQYLDTAIKWLEEFDYEVQGLAKTGVKYAICNHATLARYQYRCFTFKDKWVVAYKIAPGKVTI